MGNMQGANQEIHAILVDLASQSPERLITYGDLGAKIGRFGEACRSWPELDEIAAEERAAGRPDLSLLVVLKETGYPSKYLQRPFSDAMLEKYLKDLAALRAFYRHR